MKQNNKSPLGNIGCCLGALLFSPILLVIIVLHILYTPIDYIRYKTSAYYKDTKQKYTWLVSTSLMFKIYELVKKHGISITYKIVPDTNSVQGYLIATDTLLIIDDYAFLGENGEWYINVENDDFRLVEAEKMSLDEYEKDYGERLCGAVRLIALDDIPEGEAREKALATPGLLVYDKGKKGDLVSKLDEFAKSRLPG